MKCADPVLCYLNSKGNRTFINFSFARKRIGGIPLDHIVFDCGKCLSCRKKKAYELACRCVLHASLYKDNCFLTLTYDEKKKGYHNEFEYRDIQLFKKRLRKYFSPERVQIFNVHEYGRNGKKHWHCLVFNADFEDKTIHRRSNDGQTLYTSRTLEKLWPHGFNTIGNIESASAMYTAQYLEKDFKNHNVTNDKRSHSKHSGLGKEYFEKHYRQILTLGYVPFNGSKFPVPRYFQKLAHKNWAWFYDRSYFEDTSNRSRVYTPFSESRPANLDMGNLWPVFKLHKDSHTLELESRWDDVILQFLTTHQDPDFIKSNSNALYDLRNKTKKEIF